MMRLPLYRLVKFLIIAFPIFYLFMVGIKPVFNVNKEEIFPFFSWRLFPHVPPRHKTGYAVILHSADGAPRNIEDTRYLIPSRSIGHMKSLRQVVRRCRLAGPDDCTKAVIELLYPTVMALAGSRDVEFSIVRNRIDLREVQKEIHEISRGKAKSNYYRPDRVIGRWSTREGPVGMEGLASVTRVLESRWDIYRNDGWLVYVKDTCSIEDISPRFYLHLTPVNVNDLPEDRKQYGFDNLDFRFADYRLMSARECVALRQLPDYDIIHIETGQFSGDVRHWGGGFRFSGK